MKMRGAASSPSALCRRISSARLVSLPTSRMVVMPQASQMLSSYSSGCGLPPRSPCRWACAVISSGGTDLPVASITASAIAPPSPRLRLAAALLLQVGVRVDQSGEDVFAGGVYYGIGLGAAPRGHAGTPGGGDGLQRDNVGDRVVLVDNVLGAAGGRHVATDHDGIVDQQAAHAFAAGRRLRRRLGDGGTGERERGERDEQGSGHGNDCGM